MGGRIETREIAFLEEKLNTVRNRLRIKHQVLLETNIPSQYLQVARFRVIIHGILFLKINEN